MMTASSIGPLVAQLRQDILQKSGYSSVGQDRLVYPMYADWLKHFPFRKFPTGAVHQLLCGTEEEKAASIGFLLGVVRQFLSMDKPLIWISRSSGLFPSVLQSFGLSLQQYWGVQPEGESDLFWCTEQSLRYAGDAVVVATLPRLSFKQSRRFQLAVEQSGATGFILQEAQAGVQTTACVSRWRIQSIPSEPIANLPGMGRPAWRVVLERVRNGKPGAWDFYWQGSHLLEQTKLDATHQTLGRTQTG
jgi:protein ImuA